MDKWKEFLKKEGYTKEQFAELDASKMAELTAKFQSEQIKAINDAVTDKADAETVKTMIADAIKAIPALEMNQEIIDLKKTVKEQGEEITALLKNKGNGTSNDFWGEFQKQLEGNKDGLAKMKESNSKAEVEFVIKAPALMTTANAGTGIAFNPAYLTEVVSGVASAPKQQPYLLNHVNRRSTNARTIYWIDRTTSEGDAEFIGEGELKPLVDVDYEPRSSTVKKVAERWKYSEEMMDDTQFILADARDHFEELIRLKIDDKIFDGDSGSTATETDGVTTFSSAFVAPTALANAVADANLNDAIVAAATQIRLANFMPSKVFLNPADVATQKLQKATDGHYIMPPFATVDGMQVDGLTVISTNRIPQGKILIGDLSKYTVAIKDDVTFKAGWENDDFSKNLRTFLLEARLVGYMSANHSAAIIYDDIANIKALLDPAVADS